jgi:AAA family ATP:ADP antiporter
MAEPAGATEALPRGPGFLSRFVDLRPGEAPAALWAFTYFFLLLGGYYILRPIREEMGIRGGVEKLHWNFTATFAAMLVALPVYSALVARVPRARAVPMVYRFFALNLLVFYALVRSGVAPGPTARAFFVWVSVYNLFVVSVFWSFLADLFTGPQGRRLFGFVAAGGSAGALAGPVVAGGLAGVIGIANLLLASAALLEASTFAVRRLVRWSAGSGASAERAREAGSSAAGAPLGGTVWSGIRLVFSDRYLSAIALQMVLFTLGSTLLYFQTARLVAQAFPDPARRTALFASVDFAVNLAALLTQSLATGALVAALGLGAALAIVPALSAAGFLVGAAFPTLWVLAIFQALRRAASYAVERPAREVLFTVVTREEKYKSKGFIDTVVYRAGDAGSAWVSQGLTAAGMGISASLLAAAPIGLAGVGIALWLARRQKALEARP